MLRVLVVDDKVLYRKVLSDILAEMEGVEVVGLASTSKTAVAKAQTMRPDLVALNFEMPEMDGLDILGHIKKNDKEIDVVLLSSQTKEGADAAMQALEGGAFTFVTKPDVGNPLDARKVLAEQLQPIVQTIIDKKKAGGQGKMPTAPVRSAFSAISDLALSGKPLNRPVSIQPARLVKIVAIGISTGGPNSLLEVIPLLPADLRVPLLIVQHMPPDFTAALAVSLNNKSAIKVVEAREGMVLEAGVAYIARGGYHMKVVESGGVACLRLTNDPPENHCRPAADYLFRSVAKVYGKRAIGIIMTGMGADGKEGLKVMKEVGAQVIAQDEQSCVVYGMPLEVVKAGLADCVVPLGQIAAEITKRVNLGD